MAATTTALAATNTNHGPSYGVSSRAKPYLVEQTINFADQNIDANGSTIECVDIPANCICLYAGIEVETALTNTASDATVDLGLSGGDADSWVDGFDIDNLPRDERQVGRLQILAQILHQSLQFAQVAFGILLIRFSLMPKDALERSGLLSFCRTPDCVLVESGAFGPLFDLRAAFGIDHQPQGDALVIFEHRFGKTVARIHLLHTGAFADGRIDVQRILGGFPGVLRIEQEASFDGCGFRFREFRAAGHIRLADEQIDMQLCFGALVGLRGFILG